MLGRYLFPAFIVIAVLAAPAALGAPPDGADQARQKLERIHQLPSTVRHSSAAAGAVAHNFRVLGHHNLGMSETNGDVWVHRNTAYVGTWVDPCNGRGVKIVDVSDLRHPHLLGTLAARRGTSAEDMVARRISTSFFFGDLMAVGIQRCGEDPALDTQTFGLQLWNVSNPRTPRKLSELGLATGNGGVHELDLVQRGNKAYALVATPFTEWFDPEPAGDFRIIDVTNPRVPVQVADWGAGEHGFSRGPLWGQGSFGAMFDHSARVSKNGLKAFVSYWDLGILTFDISDVTDPVLLSRTTYKPWEDGDAHSMTRYANRRGKFILQNDEDFDPTTPADIRYGGRHGIGSESPGATPLWLEPGHQVAARVVRAAHQGCSASDYPASTAGSIAVVRTPFPFFDPPGTTEDPECLQQEQEAAAEAAGARAVVHDFIARNTSPQYFDFDHVDIPVLFTRHATAQGMVSAGTATLRARRPSWGYLRVYNARTGRQVAKFDGAPNVHTLPPPDGFWSIHNTEVLGDHAYSSWYTNGIVALDLSPLSHRRSRDPVMVGQFVPAAAPDHVAIVWGVYVRRSDGVVFASDMESGLWIVKPTGAAAPGDDDGDVDDGDHGNHGGHHQ
jgi:hypothetical protein